MPGPIARQRKRVAALRKKVIAQAKRLAASRKLYAAAKRRLTRLRRTPSVARPLKSVLADSWGYHPPVHDGIDLICPARAPIYAMVRSRVLRADTGGWWGKSPSGDVTKGDGIVVLECLESVGPFRKGLRVCYGHAERPTVQVGQVVPAGARIGEAGLAVAWHIHLMVHGRNDARGVGDRDPGPFYRYAMKHGR